MSDRESKQFSGAIEFKGPREGSFTATFSTFNVVDHDGDVTLPGAFKDGQAVIIGAWGHKTQDLPSGRGIIRTNAVEATVEGQFFMDTAPGRETYNTVKGLGPLGEWSYVFEITKATFGEFEGRRVRFLHELKVYSVDPVLAGAGINTRTTAIKASGGWRVDLERYREKNELRLAEMEFKKILADVELILAKQPGDSTEVEPWCVPVAVRWAASEGAGKSAARLGIPPADIRYFTQPAHVKQLLGFTYEPKSIWLRADLDEATAFSVACHEMRHQAQPADVAGGAAEADAYAFAAEMVRRAS